MNKQSKTLQEDKKTDKSSVVKEEKDTFWSNYFEKITRMWVNVLLFLLALVTAAYFYLTRHVGWFKARGIDEIDYVFPFGCQEMKQTVMGKTPFVKLSSEIYKK